MHLDGPQARHDECATRTRHDLHPCPARSRSPRRSASTCCRTRRPARRRRCARRWRAPRSATSRSATIPTVNVLCERVAALLGKEAAVFMPSGTMCNVAATLAHCRPGDEILAHETAHILAREGGAHAALGGFQITALPGADGQFTPDTFRTALHPRTPLPAAADRGQRRADRQYRRRHDLAESRSRRDRCRSRRPTGSPPIWTARGC